MTSETQEQVRVDDWAKTHNGWLTITSPKTGDHRTFQIKTSLNENFACGKRIVSLLVGPDREDYRNWKGFGFATDSGIRVWKSRRGGKFEQYARMLDHQAHYKALGCEYLVESRCRRCNRPLSHPESLASGIGPECREKM